MSRWSGITEKHRIMPAVVVAAATLAYLMFVRVLGTFVTFTAMLVQSSRLQDNIVGSLVSPRYVFLLLAFSLGVFVWMWLFSGLSAGSPLAAAIAHSLIAVFVGAFAAFVVSFGISMQSWFANAQFFSNSLDQAVSSFLRDGADAFVFVFGSVVALSTAALPVVVLAVVLVWNWLVKRAALQSDAPTSLEV